MIKIDGKKKNIKTSDESAGSNGEDEILFSAIYDGMTIGTAKLVIDKKLRKQLLENYDLIELINKRPLSCRKCIKQRKPLVL